jgi:putative ABC transport system ATP-binding protein
MIEVKSLSKNFNAAGGDPASALMNVSLAVEKGRWLNVVGPNGSGKSTLLRLIAGELTPDSGGIFYNGTDIGSMPQDKRADFIQYVEADTKANLVPSMTIEQNLFLAQKGNRCAMLPFSVHSPAREQIRASLADLALGLENRLQTQVRFLSSGERQAVVVAKTILRQARILLLDEFTGALDPTMAPKLLDTVKQMATARQLSVLMVTHDLDLIERTAEHTIFLKKGEIYARLEPGKHSRKELIELYQVALNQPGPTYSNNARN